MAVTGGRYFNAEMAYAAGAPRSNETGQVFIFTRGTMMTNPMYEKVILNGEQFASSFGYELCTADGEYNKALAWYMEVAVAVILILSSYYIFL